MSSNRIQRYERLWKESTTAPSGVPAGFAVIALGQLPPGQQAAFAAQRSLYQWAYDKAREEAAKRFADDWTI